jgi:hypothetical protein
MIFLNVNRKSWNPYHIKCSRFEATSWKWRQKFPSKPDLPITWTSRHKMIHTINRVNIFSHYIASILIISSIWSPASIYRVSEKDCTFFSKIQSVQLTPLSTHWAPRKKNKKRVQFFSDILYFSPYPIASQHSLSAVPLFRRYWHPISNFSPCSLLARYYYELLDRLLQHRKLCSFVYLMTATNENTKSVIS